MATKETKTMQSYRISNVTTEKLRYICTLLGIKFNKRVSQAEVIEALINNVSIKDIEKNFKKD